MEFCLAVVYRREPSLLPFDLVVTGAEGFALTDKLLALSYVRRKPLPNLAIKRMLCCGLRRLGALAPTARIL